MSHELALATGGASFAAIALLAGGGGRFAWQDLAHRRAGQIVELEVSGPQPTYQDTRVGSDRLIVIKVINKERAPIIVTKLGISFGSSKAEENISVPRPQPQWVSALPTVVVPGGTPAQFGVLAAELKRLQARSEVPFADVWPWVELVDGRRVRSNTPVPHT